MPMFVLADTYDISKGNITITATADDVHTVTYYESVGGEMKTKENDTDPIVTGTYTYKPYQNTPLKVKFWNSASWRKVYIYSWAADGTNSQYTGAWPGTAIEAADADGWFSHEFTEQFEQGVKSLNVIFNSGSDQNKTQDIFVDEDACYVWIEAEKKAGYSATCSPDDTPVERVEIGNKEIPVLDFNAPAYNVLGQRVDAHYKGIVIQNGHKFLVR